MDGLKKKWRSMYLMEQIFAAAGIVVAAVCLVMGEPLYAVVFLLLILLLMMSLSASRTKRLSRKYGTLYFHTEDGQMVPFTFEQVKAEYMHGQGGKYHGRKVTVCFPYDKLDEEGDFKTGFGLVICKDGWQDEEGLLPALKRGDLISATGEFVAVNPKYFCIGKLTSIQRATEEMKYI